MQNYLYFNTQQLFLIKMPNYYSQISSELYPTETQWFITRRCNLHCGYCNLTKRKFKKELDAEEVKEGIMNLENLGINTVKFLGGEPTVREDLEEIINFANKTKLEYAVLSNSMFDDSRLDSLADAGINGYIASVDGLEDVKSIDRQANEKSKKGLEKLLKFREKGVKILGANFAFSRKNMEEAPKVVETLSHYGFFINVAPVVHGKGDWEFRIGIPDEFKFRPEDVPKIDGTMRELLKMKREGKKIAVPDYFMENMSRYCVNLDWHCSLFSQLRIDADGGLTICNDIRGETADKYNITNLDRKEYNKFIKDWYASETRQNCPGCYWSALVKAEQDLLAGRREFDYVK